MSLNMLRLRLARWLARLVDVVRPTSGSRMCGVCGADPCWDHCLWCGVEFRHDDYEFEPEHSMSCPLTTGVFVTTIEDLWPFGFGCCECRVEFMPGDPYTSVIMRTSSGDEWEDDDFFGYTDDGLGVVGEVVCLGCAAEMELLLGT